MALTPQNSDAFLREVDEELRREQLLNFWKRWGRLIAVAIGLFLLAFGAFLWWQNHKTVVAGRQGEKLTGALDQLGRDQTAQAVPTLQQLAKSDRPGYSAAAQMALGAIEAQKNDLKGAASTFAAMAHDESLGQPYRDLALIRQTALEFDSLPPDTIIARLKPLAVQGNPWFGSAAELTAAAEMKAGRSKEAGQLFAAIAADPGAPATLRSRAVQVAGLLGVEATLAPEQSLTR